MIVAVFVERNDPKSPVSHYFGRNRWFMLHNSADMSSKLFENPYSDSLGDAGIHSAQMLIEQDVDAVITDGVGSHSLRMLSAAGIKVYQYAGRSAAEAVKLLLDGKLAPISEAKADRGARLSRRNGRGNRK